MKTLKIVAVGAALAIAGVASAQTVPALTVSVTAPTSVAAGTNQVVSTIGLAAGTQSVTLNSLPLSLGYAPNTTNSVVAAPFTNCALFNAAGGTALNTGSNALGALGTGKVLVRFDQPLTINATSSASLQLRCTVPSTIVGGSALNTTIFVQDVVAKTATGTTVAVGGTNANGPTGTPGAVTTIGTDTTGGTGTTTAPGIPNTGAGGDSLAVWLMLTLAALTAVGAGLYIFRRA